MRDDSGPEDRTRSSSCSRSTRRAGSRRRDFFKRSAALGITVSGAGALLAACGGDDGGGRRSARGGGASGRDAAGRHSRGRRAAGRGAGRRAGQGRAARSRATTATSRVMDTGVSPNWDDPALRRAVRVHGRARRGRSLPAGALRFVDGLRRPAHVDVHDPRGVSCSSRALRSTRRWSRTTSTPSGAMAPRSRRTRTGQGRTRSSGRRSKTQRRPTPTTVVVTMKRAVHGVPGDARDRELDDRESRHAEGARRSRRTDYGATEADGTGPFTLASFQPGTEVVVNRWDEYPGTNVPYITNPGPPISTPSSGCRSSRPGSVQTRSRAARSTSSRTRRGQDIGAAAGQRRSRRHAASRACRTTSSG